MFLLRNSLYSIFSSFLCLFQREGRKWQCFVVSSSDTYVSVPPFLHFESYLVMNVLELCSSNHMSVQFDKNLFRPDSTLFTSSVRNDPLQQVWHNVQLLLHSSYTVVNINLRVSFVKKLGGLSFGLILLIRVKLSSSSFHTAPNRRLSLTWN
jgi:hypothetical protein